MQNLRQARAALKKGLRALRKQYRGTLRRGALPGGAVYQEWLRDNYYLIERESRAALRQLRRCKAPAALTRVLALCRALCPEGVVPEQEQLCAALRQAGCGSAETALVPLALRLSLALAAVESANADTPEQKVALISGAISSFRALPDIDFDAILEQVSPLERTLRRDPLYPNLDENTRALYRHLIEGLAKKHDSTEEDYAAELLKESPRHIGLPLMEHAKRPARGKALLICETVIPAVIAAALAVFFRAWYLFPLLCIPLWGLCKVLLEAIFLRGVESLPLPRLNLSEVPPEGRTLITVANLLPPAEKASALGKRMEELRNSNGGPNVAVCMLADLKSADQAVLAEDERALKAVRGEVARLNERYGGGFIIAVRHRRYSPTMGNYAGRERKRGAISDLIALIRGEGGAEEQFCLLAGDLSQLHQIKYLLALDADTELPLGSLPEMVAAALHPANHPKFDATLGRVTHGYGVLAPHVEFDLNSTRKTAFAHTMAGEGGHSPYANHVSERYQDLFGCGIFAGKGLIDIDAFAAVQRARPMPEEQVLSHDILEGGYLRTGFLADVHVSDGFPARHNSFFARQERWVRGDWQNILFLRKLRGLPSLARYQLFDNLRRSMLAPACLAAIAASVFVPRPFSIILALGGVLGMCGGYLVAAWRSICSGGFAMLARDYYSGGLPAALGDVTRAALQVITLAQAAWVNLCAAVRGLWRSFVTRKRRLEWTTAAQSEQSKGGLAALLPLWPSLVMGVFLLVFGRQGHRLAGMFLLANLLFAPLTARQKKENTARLDEKDNTRVQQYCADMWNYFETYCTAEHNFLPPDNVQESPVFRVAHRSSPTNIGLYLLCTLAARDLDLIDSDGLETRLSRSLDSIDQLERWKGNLLNWYDTKTLQPLEPRYVSAVDSGNLLVSLRVLRVGLEEYLQECPALAKIQDRLKALEEGCDLTSMYHPRRRLFHIGIDLSEGRVSPSYYDLLMSESRMTSYYAIATRMVPKKHWGSLGRTLARQGRYTGPVSWTGTMFEYFMPYLFLDAPKGTLGYEALRFCLHCQKRRVAGHKLRLPWGNSESGFFAFDPCLNYQYKAHGTQKLGLRRGLDEELVLSPYSSFLAMQLAPKSALRNLQRFEQLQLYGSCGFYEAADATPGRANGHGVVAVRSYMAHHVGMSLLSALNTLQDGILRKRFFADGEMASAKSLLYERIPDRASVYRDIDLRDTLRPREKATTAKQIFTSVDPAVPRTHLLSNGEWSCVVSDCGANASFYRGASILKHSRDLLRRPSGMFVLLREEPSKRAGVTHPPELVSITPAPYYNAAKARVEFNATEVLHYGEGRRVGVTLRTRVHPRLPAEERRVQMKNLSRQRVKGSVWLYLEPSLAPLREEAEHPAFSKLFLTGSYDENTRTAFFTRRKNETGETLSLAVACNDERAICERSREIALRRGVPFGGVKLQEEANKAAMPDACAAFEVPFWLAPGESREFSLFLCAGVSESEAARRLAQLREEAAKNPRRGGAPYPFRMGEMADALARRIVPKLLYYAPATPAQLAAQAKLTSSPQALWSVGVSGDMPYLYLPVDSIEDLPEAMPYFTLFRRLGQAGIPCELALGYREGGDYNMPVSAALKEALRREGCAHLLHQRGGVHLVNLHRAAPEAIEALVAYATQICGEDCSEAEQSHLPLLDIAPTQNVSRETMSKDGIVAGSGIFCDGVFTIEKDPLPPPVPWSLPLGNPAFGTLVSDSALGFTWAVNARENKLSPWYNDPCGDNRGEMLLLKFGSRVYDMLQSARCEFTPTCARWFGQVHNLRYEVKAYVPQKGLTKRVEVMLKNETERHLTPELAYYFEPVLGTRREPHLPILGEALPDGLLLTAPASMIKGHTALLLQGGAEFTCSDRAAFLRGEWHGGGQYPQADPCAAIGRRLQIPPGEEVAAEFALNWGAQRNAALCAHLVAGGEHQETKLKIHTPDEALNHMVNTWLPHQLTACRLFGRTGHSQCGGAWGMRDQLQDVSALALTRPDLLRQQIARCAAAQFPEGDAMHWWHRLPGHATRGVRSRYADDYLWLPFVCADYVTQTGDYAFLHKQIPFRDGAVLEPHEKDRYAAYSLGKERASLYEHCTRALDRALTLTGQRGLPLMMGGDWNDGMNAIGAKGQGESVWLGMFLAMGLEKFAALCKHENDLERGIKYLEEARRLKEAIDQKAWTGDRYLRAFFDDGTPLGGGSGQPCSIDLLPQSFSVLCDMPDKERRNTALSSAAECLVNPYGIRLLREPFTHHGRRAGYINDYPPGLRENGGQYTHAALWFIMALLREGRTDEAYNYLRLINPADFCQNETRMARYRGEPYALAGDVNYAPGCEGRAGWTLYTGSAAWFLRCVTEEILGIRMDHGEIHVNPNLPKPWLGYDIKAELVAGEETRELL